jgi:hypothetical protein
LQVLDSYRYLDRCQLQALFFVGPRSCQYRLRWLVERGYLGAWQVRVHPRHGSRPSIYYLSTLGARVLAERQDIDPAPFIKRAEHARTRRFFLEHDLRANQFVVDLCMASRERDDLGVYHWVGPRAVRSAYADEKEQGPIPDAWARLLVGEREVLLHLEWDQGTEPRRLLKRKVAVYVTYFADRPQARCNHVLFVVPTPAREAEVQRIARPELPDSTECCKLWTAPRELLEAVGPLGPAWREVGGNAERASLVSLSTRPRQAGPVADTIGKALWWERRPGGGEGA